MRPLLPALLLALAGPAVLAGCAEGGVAGRADPAPGATSSSGSDAPTSLAAPSLAPGPDSSGPSDALPTDELSSLAELAEQQATRAPVLAEAVLGGDISWPQCPPGMGIPEKRTLGMPMPIPEARYVIIGLTNGPGFTPNPCLADQVAWVRERRLLAAAYAVASFPDAATLREHGDDGPYDGGGRLDALRNTGYQQARYNLASMRAAGLPSPVLWIDVEPVPDFAWSDDKEANAAVVEGVARGYVDAGLRIGVYSTPHLWETVVGDFRLGVPEWRAAGQTSRAEALERCDEDWTIQGGSGVLGQWVEDRRDQNVTCPGVGDLREWFHRF